MKILGFFLTSPRSSTALLRVRKDWNKRITLLATMQNLDNQVAFNQRRDLFTWSQPGVRSMRVKGRQAPT